MTQAALNLDACNSANVCGRKTRIRPMRPDEAAIVYPWTQDPDVHPFWGATDHYADLDDFLRQWDAYYLDGSKLDHGRCFTVEADNLAIGMVNYNSIDVASRSTEIDIVIGHPDYRDRGYGTDALRAFLRFLFDIVGLHRVWLATYDYNTRARRVYENLGFVEEGILRQSAWVDGRWADNVLYGLLKPEFRRADSVE